MLAAMAAATSRLRLGCQVTGMPYRHPSVLANIAATVDVISDGRLIIGLGAGWNQDESDALGIRLPPLKERFDQFEEGVQVIIALLSEDRASFDGRALHAAPRRGASRSRCSARTRRSPSAATASGARCGSSPQLRPALELDARRRRRVAAQGARCSTATAPTSGATRRRSSAP